MTKFEIIGIELQNDAETKKEAIRQFSYSCRVCCTRGIHLECDRCAISATHKMTLASFEDAKQHVFRRNGRVFK